MIQVFSDFELGMDAYISNKPFDSSKSQEWQRGWHAGEDDDYLRQGEESDYLNEWAAMPIHDTLYWKKD